MHIKNIRIAEGEPT